MAVRALQFIILLWAVLTIVPAIQHRDTIQWGISEASGNVPQGILIGVIEYADNVYGDTVQGALRHIYITIYHSSIVVVSDRLPNNEFQFQVCRFKLDKHTCISILTGMSFRGKQGTKQGTKRKGKQVIVLRVKPGRGVNGLSSFSRALRG